MVLLIIVGGIIFFKELHKPAAYGREINQLSSTKLSVIGVNSGQLNTSAVSVDIPSNNNSGAVQSVGTNPGEASSSPLQSNTKVNDPALANNPLIQSLFTDQGNQ